MYARACLEVARQCGLRDIDIWSRMQRFPGWEKSFLRYAARYALWACLVGELEGLSGKKCCLRVVWKINDFCLAR